MGGSSKGGTTTVRETNEPPAWAAPLLTQSAQDAQQLYDSGSGFNIWPHSTVAEPSWMTTQGMQGLANTAMSPGTAALSQTPVDLSNQMLSQGGLMAPSHEAMGFFGDVATGAYNPQTGNFGDLYQSAGNMAPGIDAQLEHISQSAINPSGFGDLQGDVGAFGDEAQGWFDPFRTGETAIGTGQDFRDIYGRAQQPGAAENYLTETARGDFLAEGNPYFRSILEKESERLGDQISGLFSGSGRYGSGAHQGVMGEEVGNFMERGLSSDFSRERALQMQAAQTMEQAQQGRLGQQLAAMAGLSGVEGQNIANQMDAATTQAGLGQNLLGLQRALEGDITGLESQNLDRQLSTSLAQRGFAGDDWQRQMGAAGNLFGAEQQNLQNQTGAAGAGADLSNRGLEQALGYINALPTIQQNQLFGPQTMLQAGGMQDQSNQAAVNDMIRRFYETDMQDWTRLGALQAAAQGSAGNYGMSTQAMRQPGPSPLGIFGSLLGLAGGFI